MTFHPKLHLKSLLNCIITNLNAGPQCGQIRLGCSEPEGNTLPAKWHMYVHKPLKEATLVQADKKNEAIMQSNEHENY